MGCDLLIHEATFSDDLKERALSTNHRYVLEYKEARWHSGRASDSEWKGPGFDPDRRHHVMSLSKTH